MLWADTFTHRHLKERSAFPKAHTAMPSIGKHAAKAKASRLGGLGHIYHSASKQAKKKSQKNSFVEMENGQA